MLELWQEAIKPVNLPYTILFGISMLYWILYIVGVLGSDLLEFMDFDMDLDADAGADLDAGAGHHGGAFVSVMKFLHAGDVPVTVIASALAIFMWAVSILTNFYWNHGSAAIAIGLTIPIAIGGMVLTRFSLMPFVPLLKRAFDESGDSVEILGKLCVVTSIEVTSKYGQAEVPHTGTPLAINVKTEEGVILKKGDEAVVIDQDRADDIYIVTKFEDPSGVNSLEEDPS